MLDFVGNVTQLRQLLSVAGWEENVIGVFIMVINLARDRINRVRLHVTWRPKRRQCYQVNHVMADC